MTATRTSPNPDEITPAQRRHEIIAILAAALVRMIRPGEKLSESGETGLELSRESRLTVPAG